ncbi:MAG: tail fiber domain-containing protein [Bacteroidales bacterium]
MKTKVFYFISRGRKPSLGVFYILLFLLPVLSPEPCALSQTPPGFNYQAVARNSSGDPIVNTTLSVKLSVLTDTTGFRSSGSGTYIWEETHTGITTNAFGMFTVVLGTGIKTQGSANTFSEINWTSGTYFVGTKISQDGGSTWKIMGAAKIWSVPYSIVTESIAKGAKVAVVSNDDLSQDALFEVKRKDGQTVFAVYNDAVNVFVPNSGTKGKKGGFAIGGFDQSKQESQDLLIVTSDSIRIYIDDNPSKGVKGGFAIGGFDGSKSDEKKYLSLYGKSTIDTVTNASQIMWYPNKEAFLAGKIDILHPDSVGINSFSTGYKTMAKGDYSHAFGYESVARGNYSTAIGRRAIAGTNSFALGNFSSALGNDSYAIGSASQARNNTAFALGVGSIASGEGSMSMGIQSEASGIYSVAIGYQAKAQNETAHAFGLKSEATGFGSIALGMYSEALNDHSTSLGFHSRAEKEYSMALGYFARAGGYDSYAIGSYAEATGEKSFAIGSYGINEDGTLNTNRKTLTPAYYSLAFGMGAQSTALGSMALGVNSTASGSRAVSIGFGTTATGDFSTALGYKSIANGFKAISIGGHYNFTFTKLDWVYDPASGEWNFVRTPVTYDKDNIAQGDYSIAIGNGNISTAGGLALGTNNSANAFASVAIGHSNIADSAFSFVAGYNNIATGVKAFALGEGLEVHSANSFAIGTYNVPVGLKNVWSPFDPIFLIGNGNPNERSNAFMVLKNGWIVLNNNIPEGTGANLAIDPLNNRIVKTSSSVRYKTNISTLENINWLYSLRPVSFAYKNDPEKRQLGLIAEEVAEINPDLVIYGPDCQPEAVNYNGMIAPVIKALQNQKETNEYLLMKYRALENENNELKNRIATLEQIVSQYLNIE